MTPMLLALIAAPMSDRWIERTAPPSGWVDPAIGRLINVAAERPSAPAIGSVPDGGAATPSTLTGVIIAPSDRWAVFNVNGVRLVAHEGERVCGMVVEAIRPGQVVMRGPAGTELWRIGNGTFVPPPPGPERPSEQALHSRGQDGQHAE